MGELTREEMRERLGNIDQIRDIIVGSQLREFSTRFDKIEAELSRMQQDSQGRIEQVKTVLTNEIRTALDSMEKKIKSVSLTSSEESADLRQQIERTKTKFSNTIEALDEAVSNQTNSIRDEFLQSRDRLQEEVLTLKNQVFEELDRRFSMLRDVKVSRHDMAEILFELGMRLKGVEFVPELKEAADTRADSDVLLIDQMKTLVETEDTSS